MDQDLLATPKRSRDAVEDAGCTPSKASKRRRKLNYGKHSVIIIIIMNIFKDYIFFYSILYKLFIAKYIDIYIFFLFVYFQIQTKALWKITLRRMKIYL